MKRPNPSSRGQNSNRAAVLGRFAGAIAVRDSTCITVFDVLTIYIDVNTINPIQIEFDDDKRDATLALRGLDFADAPLVFGGRHFTAEDLRDGYAEQRFITIGMLRERMVVVVWTPRGGVRCIFSMRKANEREQQKYAQRLA